MRIKDINHYVGNSPREVDIELMNGIIIQVKNLSSAQKITEQLDNTVAATGQTVIGYVVQNHKKATDIINDVNRGKHVATNNIDDLIALVR